MKIFHEAVLCHVSMFYIVQWFDLSKLKEEPFEMPRLLNCAKTSNQHLQPMKIQCGCLDVLAAGGCFDVPVNKTLVRAESDQP